MPTPCHSCHKDLALTGTIGRGAECPHCRADVRCCLNCKHYDRSAYNECREPQAERVLDKDRANFCDFFALSGGVTTAKDEKSDALKKLDQLFK